MNFKKRIRSIEGTSLVSLLASFVMVFMGLLALNKTMSILYKSTNGIGSNLELARLSEKVNMVLAKESMCRSSGLLGVTLDPTNPGLTPIVLYNNANVSSSSILAQQGVNLNNVRVVAGLAFTSLAPIGPVSTGTLYYGNMNMATVIDQTRTLSSRNPNKNFYTKIVLDSNNKIVDCGNDIVWANNGCTGNNRVRGLAANGTLNCGLPQTPDYDSGWKQMLVNPYPILSKVTVTHGLNLPNLNYSVYLEFGGDPGASPSPSPNPTSISGRARSYATYAVSGKVVSAGYATTGWTNKQANSVDLIVQGVWSSGPRPSPTVEPPTPPQAVWVRALVYID